MCPNQQPDLQEFAVSHTVQYWKNPAIAIAFEAAAKTPEFKEELNLLDRLALRVNQLSAVPDGERDPDLKSVYDTRFQFGELPLLFGWKDDAERRKWSRRLIQTLDSVNKDVGDYYRDPLNLDKVPDMFLPDIFRWYLLDGYCRWVADPKLLKSRETKKLRIERFRADIVCFALCEAAVLGAEEGEQGMRELVAWMLHFGWIGVSKEHNLTKKLFARAEDVVEKD